MTDKLKPIGWFTEDYKTDKSATTYDPEVAQRWRDKGWPVSELYTRAPPVPVGAIEFAVGVLERLEVLGRIPENKPSADAIAANAKALRDFLEATCKTNQRHGKDGEGPLGLPLWQPWRCIAARLGRRMYI